MEKENRGLRIHHSLFSSTLIIPIFSVFILLIFILVDQTLTDKKMGKRFKGYTIFSEQKKVKIKKNKKITMLISNKQRSNQLRSYRKIYKLLLCLIRAPFLRHCKVVYVFFQKLSDRANMKLLELEFLFMKTTSNSLTKGDRGVVARIFYFEINRFI